jgi:hypothetical protein
LDQKQKTVVLIVLIIVFLSIVMTERELWSLINLQNIHTVTKIIVPALELSAVFFCVRLYRAFNNQFFKFQGIALAMGVLNTGLYELRVLIVKQILYNNEEALYQIFSTSMNFINTIIGLAGILLTLYAILQYRENWEQGEKAHLVKRFNDLVPSARGNRLFWPVVLGVPLLLIIPPVLSSLPIDAVTLFSFSFYTAGLVVQLLGLLLCLALSVAYGNKFFKYMAAVYIIPLAVTLFSHFHGFLSLIFHRCLDSSPPALYMLSNITFNYIVVFHELVIAGLMVIALLAYRESGNSV